MRAIATQTSQDVKKKASICKIIEIIASKIVKAIAYRIICID